MKVNNQNTIGSDYDEMAHVFRPSHADYTYSEKYGHRAHVGGGRSSVRETIGRVAAAGLARVILERELGIQTVGWVDSIGNIDSQIEEFEYPESRDFVDQFPTRCPKKSSNDEMETLIRKLRDEGDSVGGVVKVVVRNLPPGLGDPVYDKLDADLAKAILSISACKGFEVALGFREPDKLGANTMMNSILKMERVRSKPKPIDPAVSKAEFRTVWILSLGPHSNLLQLSKKSRKR